MTPELILHRWSPASASHDWPRVKSDIQYTWTMEGCGPISLRNLEVTGWQMDSHLSGPVMCMILGNGEIAVNRRPNPSLCPSRVLWSTLCPIFQYLQSSTLAGGLASTALKVCLCFIADYPGSQHSLSTTSTHPWVGGGLRNSKT